MTATDTAHLRTLLTALPKVDLHRHLEGSIRLETLVAVARQYGLELPAYDVEGLRSYVQVMPGSPMNATNFLSKFTVLRRFFYSPDVIKRIAREAVEDAAADNIKYMELRCTPKALSKLMDFSFDQVVSWVCEAVGEAARFADIRVRVIISMNRHESLLDAERAVRAAINHLEHGVVAVDLAGQEAGFPAEPFYPLFAQAKKAGLGITVHAGEWDGPENIRDAIEFMGAQRIGHGVRVIEDSRIAQLARETGLTFEVCPTSNVQSGSVHGMEQHPLRDMIHLGLKSTINTDDPSVSNIKLSDELVCSIEQLGLTLDEVKRCILNGAQCAFLPEEERVALVAYFTNALMPIGQARPQ